MIQGTRIWRLATIVLMVGYSHYLLGQPTGEEAAAATESSQPMSTTPLPLVTFSPPPIQTRSELEPREPARAEYAVRWDPSEGGFANAREVLVFLNAHKRVGEVFEVRYFDLAPTSNAPPDATTIVRQRSRVSGKAEIRLKYRRTQPLVEIWECPSDAPYEKSEEVDVSFIGTGRTKRVYSYSCTLTAPQPPASLNAVPKKCMSQMVRYEFHKFKIEEWTLPGGNVKVEVSHAAPNNSDEQAKFAEFVSKLRERGVKPSDQSKTELGSRCP